MVPAAPAELNTVDLARAICAAIQPLTGPAAAGKLLVHSTGPTGTVQAGAMAVPVRAGSLEEAGVVFVQKKAGVADGSWAVTSSGVLVDVQAINGGPIGNGDPGGPYRWAPTLTGIEATSAADGSGVTGGSFLAVAPLRQVRQYKQLTKADLVEFFQAQLSDFPAVAIAWEGLQPLGGSMGSSPGPRTARAGTDVVLYRNTWLLFVVTSRLDTEIERRTEGDALRDAIVQRLHQRIAARGLRVSMAPGAEVLDARVFKVTPTSFVDVIRIGTSIALQFQHEEAFNDWLRTRIVEETAVGADGLRINIVDTKVPMPPNGTVP